MIRWFKGITVEDVQKSLIKLDAMEDRHNALVQSAIADRTAAVKQMSQEIADLQKLQ